MGKEKITTEEFLAMPIGETKKTHKMRGRYKREEIEVRDKDGKKKVIERVSLIEKPEDLGPISEEEKS